MGTSEQDYSGLFSAEADEELEDPFADDEVFATSPRSRERRRSSTGFAQQNPNYFGPAQSRLLARHLTHTQLPGLSSLDQMYLLALADTVANTKVDFSENDAADVAVKKGECRCTLLPTIIAANYSYPNSCISRLKTIHYGLYLPCSASAGAG